MKTLDITEAHCLLASYVVDPNQEPVILTVKGQPVAVVLSARGCDVESISLILDLGVEERDERLAQRFLDDVQLGEREPAFFKLAAQQAFHEQVAR